MTTEQALRALQRAALAAGTQMQSLTPRPFITEPPPSDGYEPLYIPDWWHKEYQQKLVEQSKQRRTSGVFAGFDHFIKRILGIADEPERTQADVITALNSFAHAAIATGKNINKLKGSL